jgi:hypothetical protein
VQLVLEEIVALVGEGRAALFLVEREVVFRDVRNHLVDRHIEVRTVLAGAGDDQRRARLVDQDRVDLVHDGEVVSALGHLGQAAAHVVAQVVEAKLVVRGIGDVGGVGLFLLAVGLTGIDHAGGHAEGGKDLSHPFRVALGEVVVDGNDVHALSAERVQVCGEGRDKCLALAGLHLGDVALVQEDAADQLNVEGAQAQRAPGPLATIREGFRQEVVETFAVHGTLAEFRRLFDDPLVGQLLELRLQRVDPVDDAAHGLHLAVIGRAEDLFRDGSQTEHSRRLPARPPFSTSALPQIIVWGIRVVRPIAAVYQRRQDGQSLRC